MEIPLLSLRRPIIIKSGNQTSIVEDSLYNAHEQIQELFDGYVDKDVVATFPPESTPEQAAAVYGAPLLAGFIGPMDVKLDDGRKAWAYAPSRELQALAAHYQGMKSYLQCYMELNPEAFVQSVATRMMKEEVTPEPPKTSA